MSQETSVTSPSVPPASQAPASADPATTDPAAVAEETEYRQRPASPAFRSFIASGWAPLPGDLPAQDAAAPFAAQRRARLGAQFTGVRLVIPSGGLRQRSNDTDYRFRPHSAFAHLTGLGGDTEPDQVLVLEPLTAGAEATDGSATHEARLYLRPRAGRDTKEFYADARYGELWVGARPDLAEMAALTGLVTRALEDADAELVAPGPAVAIVRGADARLDDLIDTARAAASQQTQGTAADADLARAVSELRLVKDEYEIGQMRLACEITASGFADIVRSLPAAVASARGERVVETAFDARARTEGNDVGYSTIVASGNHACTLHWIRNDGQVRAGDLMLVDAGAEVPSLYTADITRTLPVNGRFSPAQRTVYQAVLDAADAAFAVARPGARFRDLHAAAMDVIAARLQAWGLLPDGVDVATTLSEEGQFHRRWMVHGTSHHLGIDVHDCAQARREMYLDAVLEPGMIFTIEPGLYFRADDQLAPEGFRGIGVRIEDDVLVTATGCENLSAALPRAPEAIEAWMASLTAHA